MENKQYLLDTNILIEFMDGNPSVVEHVLSTGIDHCCMSVVSLHVTIQTLVLIGQMLEKYYYQKRIRRISLLRN